MTRLSAGVQYDDWKGSAAADEADMRAISQYLREQGLIGDKDHVEAISFYSGEHGFLSISAYVVPDAAVDSYRKALDSGEALPMIEVDLDIDAATFLSLFKRFNVVISRKGALEGRECETD